MIQIKTAITGGIMLSNAKVRLNEIVVPSRADFASGLITWSLAGFLRPSPQQSDHLPAQLHYTLQRPRRHSQNFFKQSRHRRQELQHRLQTLLGVRVALSALGFLHA